MKWRKNILFVWAVIQICTKFKWKQTVFCPTCIVSNRLAEFPSLEQAIVFWTWQRYNHRIIQFTNKMHKNCSMLFPPQKLFKLGNTCSAFGFDKKKSTGKKLFGWSLYVRMCTARAMPLCMGMGRCVLGMCVCLYNKCGCVKLFRVKFPCVLRSEPHFIHPFMCVCRGFELHSGLKIFWIYLLIFRYIVCPCVGVLIAQPMAALYYIHLNFHLMEHELHSS